MPTWLWVWGPAAAQMIAIFFLSNQAKLPSLPGGLTGYTGHLIGYALLGALMLRALVGADCRRLTPGIALAAWALSCGYGITDEFHQSFVPGRTATFDDLVADACGAALSIVGLVIWRRVRQPAARTRGL